MSATIAHGNASAPLVRTCSSIRTGSYDLFVQHRSQLVRPRASMLLVDRERNREDAFPSRV